MMFEMMFLWWCDVSNNFHNNITEEIAGILLKSADQREIGIDHLRLY